LHVLWWLMGVWSTMLRCRERFVGLPCRTFYAGLSKKDKVRSEEKEDTSISKNELILENIIDSPVR
jgi:hypothetical protein